MMLHKIKCWFGRFRYSTARTITLEVTYGCGTKQFTYVHLQENGFGKRRVIEEKSNEYTSESMKRFGAYSEEILPWLNKQDVKRKSADVVKLRVVK